MVLYTSVTSRTAACEPGGRHAASRKTVENVPQVHGNSLLLMLELMEETAGRGLWGWEKSCTAYLPGFEVLGTNDRGDI